ncbi:MAG: hypothetical protein H3C35_01130 [Bacteroidetes bacterium]|nr:hypothetical protein [Bacteroidota bacterium]
MSIQSIQPAGASLQSMQTSVIKKNTAAPGAVPFTEMLKENSAVGGQEVITPEEKKYFEKLFPDATEEIRSYAAYSPGGMKKHVALGTIIDARG